MSLLRSSLDEIAEARKSREADPLWPGAVAEAAAKGFRPASLWEMANLAPDDLYTYRNEVFVKMSPEERNP